MAKLFGCPINVEAEEEDGGGSSIAVEVSRSGNQLVGEATSFSAGLPPFNQREQTYPYFRFFDSNSDSGSVSMESESDQNHCFIDFFDRESYVASNQRLSTLYDFNIWGIQEMEEEIELGLGVGSGSGSGDLGEIELGLQVTGIESSRVETDTDRVGIDSGRVEIDTGRVEIDSGQVEVETGRVEVETGWVQVDTGPFEGLWDLTGVEVAEDTDADEAQATMTWSASELFEANLLTQEERDGRIRTMDYNQELHVNFFDDLLEDIFDSPLDVFMTSIDEYADDDDNHGDYEDVLARSFDESGGNGSPPASKRVVDELPDVEINSGELSIGCAICKDEIMVEEKVKRLPCRHYYHKECIVPWLGMRNTCPVCRYELPTDDLEYERSKRSQRRGSSGVARDLMAE